MKDVGVTLQQLRSLGRKLKPGGPALVNRELDRVRRSRPARRTSDAARPSDPPVRRPEPPSESRPGRSNVARPLSEDQPGAIGVLLGILGSVRRRKVAVAPSPRPPRQSRTVFKDMVGELMTEDYREFIVRVVKATIALLMNRRLPSAAALRSARGSTWTSCPQVRTGCTGAVSPDPPRLTVRATSPSASPTSNLLRFAAYPSEV